MSLLGIDVGTGGLKVMAIQADSGRVLAVAFREYPETRPRPGWVELSGDLVWDAFVEAVAEVNGQSSVQADPVTAMSFSISCDEIVPLDKHCPGSDRLWQSCRRTRTLPHYWRAPSFDVPAGASSLVSTEPTRNPA